MIFLTFPLVYNIAVCACKQSAKYKVYAKGSESQIQQKPPATPCLYNLAIISIM